MLARNTVFLRVYIHNLVSSLRICVSHTYCFFCAHLFLQCTLQIFSGLCKQCLNMLDSTTRLGFCWVACGAELRLKCSQQNSNASFDSRVKNIWRWMPNMWRGTKCMSFKFGTIKYCSLCSSGQTWQAIFSSNGNNSMVRHSNSAGDLFAEKRPDLPLGHHKAAAVGANPAIFGFLAGPRVYSFVRTLLSVVGTRCVDGRVPNCLLGGVGNDVNVPWTCLHGWCYATWWGGVGGEWC